jgi:fructokinase
VNTSFLTVGEALTDIVVQAGRETREYPGGSPLNVAVALGRLGHTSHLLTRIGDDPRGHQIRAHLEESHVQLTEGSIGPWSTSTALAQLDENNAATYVFDLVWEPDPRGLPEGVDAVHTSSIGAVVSPGRDTVSDVIDHYRPTATISYDPNARPDLMGTPESTRPHVEFLVARADVVKSSDEDVAWLYGTDDIEDVAASWKASGPAIVAITRGADGMVAFGPTGRIEVPSRKVTVADTVGAGDTFSAGILHALSGHELLGATHRERLQSVGAQTLQDVLETAARMAAITVSRPGANPPWANELS